MQETLTNIIGLQGKKIKRYRIDLEETSSTLLSSYKIILLLFLDLVFFGIA